MATYKLNEAGTAYYIRASVTLGGIRDVKRMTWTIPVNMNKRDAQRKVAKVAAEFEEKVSKGTLYDENIILSEYIDQSFEPWSKDNHRATTRDRYSAIILDIKAALGTIPIALITAQHIKTFLKNYRELGAIRNNTYLLSIDLEPYITKVGGITKAGELAGVTKNIFSRMKNGDAANHKTATAICSLFNIKLSKAFTIKERGVYSPASVRKAYNLLSLILKRAMYDDLIESNPASRVEPPKVPRKEAKAFTEEETNLILKSLDSANEPYRTAIFMLLDTGCRRGELIDWKWSNIGFNEEMNECAVKIDGSIVCISGQGLLEDDTKTEQSRRTIYLSEYAIPILREYRAWQSEQRLMAGDQWRNVERENDYVFTRWNGQPMRPDTLSGWFKKFLINTGIPELSLKSLRHTAATMMIAEGVNIRTIADRLGHSKTTTSLDIYGHAVRARNKEAAQHSPLKLRKASES